MLKAIGGGAGDCLCSATKTGHSISQNRQRDDILKHFIGLTSDSRLKENSRQL